ncbi:MAG: exodeoxyribonuclease VII small subunit [Armatimonadetes bacterium]|nr:exodeoxyribonuclease VII small subunit [Armatimonadota bacterium]
MTDEELAALSFEEAQARLEAVVAELESGQLTLDRSLALYELGLQLREHCRARLEAAEGALERLRELPDGSLASEETE